MPTYEYACKKCGEHLEVVQSFKDDPLTKCPNCGGQLRKVFGNVGIVFKGSGFYKTDSRPAAKSESGASSSSAKTDKADKSDKSDSKTDAPKEKPAADTKKSDTKKSESSTAAAS
jgi:putative FmdB family regulatory protein